MPSARHRSRAGRSAGPGEARMAGGEARRSRAERDWCRRGAPEGAVGARRPTQPARGRCRRADSRSAGRRTPCARRCSSTSTTRRRCCATLGRTSPPGCRVVITVPGGPRSAFDKHIGHRRHFDRASIDTGPPRRRAHRHPGRGRRLPDLQPLQAGRHPPWEAADHRCPERTRRRPPRDAAMRMFDRLFVLARRRGRFGWQIVASATSP